MQIWEKDQNNNNAMQIKREKQLLEEEQKYQYDFDKLKNDIKMYRIIQGQVIS